MGCAVATPWAAATSWACGDLLCGGDLLVCGDPNATAARMAPWRPLELWQHHEVGSSDSGEQWCVQVGSADILGCVPTMACIGPGCVVDSALVLAPICRPRRLFKSSSPRPLIASFLSSALV